FTFLSFVFSSICIALLYLSPFPYTTLFRSSDHLFIVSWHKKEACFAGVPWEQKTGRGVISSISPLPACLRSSPEAFSLFTFLERDRKCTRLNSSHVSISYAVFCLNKNIYLS